MSRNHAMTQHSQIADNQPVIRTSQVEECSDLLKLAASFNQETEGYSTVGLFIGSTGIGKSSSITAFMQEMGMEKNSFLPPYIAFEADPGSTPRALVDQIHHCLGEKSQRRQTKSEIAEDIETVLKNNLVQLIIIDEADRLNNISLEMVRSIVDNKEHRTSVALFGVETLLPIIRNDERLLGRLHPCMRFKELNLDEVLNVVFPQLVIPYWEYDSGDNNCIEMGEYIYKLAGPSIRKMRIFIQSASQLVRRAGDAKITMETLKASLHFTYAGAFVESESSPSENTSQSGPKERESEARKKKK